MSKPPSKLFMPILSEVEVRLLVDCINIGIANVSQQIAQGGVNSVAEGASKLIQLRQLFDKLADSEREFKQRDAKPAPQSTEGAKLSTEDEDEDEGVEVEQ